MRGVAMLLVFAVHYTVAWTLLFPGPARGTAATCSIADIVFSIGNAGVDLFMALSGYLIYDHLMRRPQGFGQYFGRRCRRVFPPYLIVLAVYVAMMLADPSKSKLPPDWLRAAIYIGECALLIPGFFGHEPIVGIAWSLTYEMLFYLLLPLLIFLASLRRRHVAWRAAIILSVGMVILAVGYRVHLHERTVMFAGGMLAREALIRWDYTFPRPRLIEASAMVAVGIAFGAMAFYRGPLPFTNPAFPDSFYRAPLLAVAFPAVLAASLGANGMLRRFFELRPLRLFGEVSYSFYLLHNLTMRVGLAFLAPHIIPGIAYPAYWLGMPAIFAICLLPGLALYAAVERPFSLRRS